MRTIYKGTKEILADVVNFFSSKKNIYDSELEFYTLTDNNTRIIQTSYYKARDLNPITKVFISINFMEEDDKRSPIPSNACIAKRDVFGEYQKLDKEELEFFDRLGFEISKKAVTETKQEITDWYGK